MFELFTERPFQLLMIAVCLIWWHRCHKYGWAKVAAVVTTILMFFGMAILEGYSLKTGELPWCFGLETKYAQATDGGPAFMLILLGLIVWYAVSWLLPKFSKWWNEKGFMPGSITKVSIAGIGLALLILTSGFASSYLTRAYGFTWGTNIVSLGGNTIAEAAEIGMSENDKMQDEMDAARANAERNAPVRPHRFSNDRTGH